MQSSSPQFFPGIVDFMDQLFRQQMVFAEERQEQLNALVHFLDSQIAAKKPAQLIFVCTHNSRRSHLAQVWAQVAAQAFGLKEVKTFSAGTEVTAMNPRALASLERVGFVAHAPKGVNPHYELRAGADVPVQICFSKLLDDAANPQSDFGAVMTCSDADERCPVIPGVRRLSLPYDDPKVADDSPAESATYDERSFQIAKEMFFVMSRVKQSLGG